MGCKKEDRGSCNVSVRKESFEAKRWPSEMVHGGKMGANISRGQRRSESTQARVLRGTQ